MTVDMLHFQAGHFQYNHPSVAKIQFKQCHHTEFTPPSAFATLIPEKQYSLLNLSC